MRRALLMATAAAILAGPLSAQERDDLRRLERARRNLVEADSLFRGYVQFLELRRSYLGLNVNTRTTGTDSIGALVHSVSPNGPADQAGIRTGDIITSLNGNSLLEELETTDRRADASLPGLRLIELTAQLDPNDTVSVEFRRGTETRRVEVVTAPPPFFVRTWRTPEGGRGYAFGTDSFTIRLDTIDFSPGSAGRLEGLQGFQDRIRDMAFFPPLFDLELVALNAGLGEYFDTTEGVLVISAPRGSRLNLKGGDVVLAVDGRKPTGPGHLMRILESYQSDETIQFAIMRRQRRLMVTGSLGGVER
ncbi:MAG: PDZ domain-containing protein [Gemmatimonadales bacterium]|nr:PDZ domain-containing protein [Gemmatimonadales bacterium]